jgi:hypothetical protein
MTTPAAPQPTHGWNRLGQAVHAHTFDHLPTNSPYARFNKWLAIKVTTAVGSMTCAYVFSVVALISLPAILSAFSVFQGVFPAWLVKASLIGLVAWIAQTYIQLVLLSVIIVGQNIQADAADARATKTFDDAEFIKDQVNEHTDGGLRAVLDKLGELEAILRPATT